VPGASKRHRERRCGVEAARSLQTAAGEDGSMAAPQAARVAVPGERLGHAADYDIGTGVYERGGMLHAALAGVVRIDDGEGRPRVRRRSALDVLGPGRG